MGSQLNPYIMYNGNARQAMEFYREIFGGELQMGTAADFGSPEPGAGDKIMHATLNTPQGYVLNAWDAPEGVPHQSGNNVAVYIGGDDSGLRTCFEKLAVGGTVTMPLEKQAWGDEAGSLIDQFGIHWMVNIAVR